MKRMALSNKKALRITLSWLIALLLALPVKAENKSTQGTKLTMNVSRSSLASVLESIESKTDYSFLYNGSIVKMNQPVSVNFENEPIEQVLDKIFAGTDITYTIMDKQIILHNADEKGDQKAQQDRVITGVVTEESTGSPLLGVSVSVKGSTRGAITDIDGKYSLSVPNDAVLQFNYIGYVPQEFKVATMKTLNVSMKEDMKVLEEVVVIGYGQMRKQDLSTAIGTVANVNQLKDRPIMSATDMLQGQIPGVTVVNNGGDPTAGASIQIRGTGSKGGETPLWVVDGVPGAPVNFNDIESITVLKDAASAAIYGAYSGSAGVILVTTKQPVAGSTSVNYEGVFGMSQATNLPQSLTIDQEKQVRQIAYNAAGKTALPDGWDPVKNPYIATNRTNWIDEIFRNAPFQRHNVALAGGTKEFSNRLSLEYSDKEGTLVGTFNKEASMRYTSMYQFNKYLRVREDFYWENYNSRGADTDSGYSGVILSALMMPRSAEAYYPDGTFGGTAPKDPAYVAQYGNNFADIHGDVINPLRSLTASTVFNRSSTVMSSTFLDLINPIDGLKFTSRYSYRQYNTFNKNFSPRRPEPGKPMLNNSLNYYSKYSTDWDWENTLNYDKMFGQHVIGVMLSTTLAQYNQKSFAASATGFSNESPDFQYFTWASTPQNSNDWYGKDRNLSFVGRLSYSWNDRYFATASYRRDYAGRLPKDHKYGDFPALTAAWKISSEHFMPQWDWLNLLKIRASWGRIGNLGSISRVGDNDLCYSYAILSNMGTTDVGGQFGTTTPIFANGVFNGVAFNPFLTWETSEQLDFGADMSFLKNRLSLSADYYQKRTYNLIKSQDSGWPVDMGIDPKLINQGEIRNQGFEISAGWKDKVGQVSYYVNGNLATLHNYVYDIGPANAKGEKAPWVDGPDFRGVLKPYRTIEGQPLYSYWLIKTDGLFQTDQEAAAYVDKSGKRIQPNAKAGDLKFVDQNGDGKIDDNDRLYMGNGMPKLTYSLMAGATWNDLTFSLMLQGVGNVDNFNAQKFITLNESQANFNRSNEILDAFPATNRIPRLTANDLNNNFGMNSDWYLENASFLRIKNITVTYDLHKVVNKSAALNKRHSSLSVFGSIDNVYTFTHYTGIDPEIGTLGFDQGKYPVPRVFSLGIKLKY